MNTKNNHIYIIVAILLIIAFSTQRRNNTVFRWVGLGLAFIGIVIAVVGFNSHNSAWGIFGVLAAALGVFAIIKG